MRIAIRCIDVETCLSTDVMESTVNRIRVMQTETATGTVLGRIVSILNQYINNINNCTSLVCRARNSSHHAKGKGVSRWNSSNLQIIKFHNVKFSLSAVMAPWLEQLWSLIQSACRCNMTGWDVVRGQFYGWKCILWIRILSRMIHNWSVVVSERRTGMWAFTWQQFMQRTPISSTVGRGNPEQ